MIPYYENLREEEKEEVTQSIQLLYKQTFLLERKFEKKSGRFQFSRDFRICDKHLEFIRSYFAISGISVIENSQIGVIYLQGENLIGEKLPKLATLYLLTLKLIYDEHMESVSTSVNIYTKLSDIHEKLANYRLLKKQPSVTEVKRTITLLKKYQIVEPLDTLEDFNGNSQIIIYPCINVVLLGDDARALLESFNGGEEDDDESEI
ncbi:DUF4194 domain-containing protein [Cohnella phaseoli]|uniref:Uncharacterized protein DUF4194 n=1 Tax=Cohnella phaseoli TaxID=456490 RepID=A0A3D9KRW8_9BACL|nr:DUF4194 domain-containing protein [Cohnella phaseoli]RED89162.1 uncharacterized protein DUF4194 [Cohnella phaseoli]